MAANSEISATLISLLSKIAISSNKSSNHYKGVWVELSLIGKRVGGWACILMSTEYQIKGQITKQNPVIYKQKTTSTNSNPIILRQATESLPEKSGQAVNASASSVQAQLKTNRRR